MLLFLFLLTLTSANSLLNLYKEVGSLAFEVATFKDVTPRLLAKHGMIKVKDDSSVIVSDFLIDRSEDPNFDAALEVDQEASGKPNEPSKLSFLQTDFRSAVFHQTESEWVPLDGCVDNRHSETVTTITRSRTAKMGNANGPNLKILLLGSLLGAGIGISSSHLLAQKIFCDVQPGKQLQVHAQTEYMTISHVKQRKMNVTQGYFSDSLNVDKWEAVSEETYYLTNYKMACVTNPDILVC